MFSVFGSPLQEDFQGSNSGRTTIRGCSSLGDGSISCPNSAVRRAATEIPSETESTSDGEIIEANLEEGKDGSDTSSGSDGDGDGDGEGDGEEVTSPSTIVTDPDGEEDEDPENFVDYREEIREPTPGRETFVGSNNIEYFTNNSSESSKRAFSPNTLLKAIMITCLFYVLAHKDTQNYLLNNVLTSITPSMYLYVAMAIFFVLFYLISVFL